MESDNQKKDIRDRVKMVREKLNLSQSSFGEKLSLERSAISLIERKQRNITERSIKDICREFNVDYIWLTQGVGGDDIVFMESDDDVVTKIDRIMFGDNEFHKNLIHTCIDLDESELIAIESILDKFIDVKSKKPKKQLL